MRAKRRPRRWPSASSSRARCGPNQSTDDLEAEALFEARRLAYPALERLGPVLTEDICVPRSQVPEMLAAIETIAARTACGSPPSPTPATATCIPLMLTPPGDDAARRAAQAAFEEMLDAAIALGGTVTGEHGVGLLKMGGMRRELDPGSLRMQEAVKARSTRSTSSTPAR